MKKVFSLICFLLSLFINKDNYGFKIKSDEDIAREASVKAERDKNKNNAEILSQIRQVLYCFEYTNDEIKNNFRQCLSRHLNNNYCERKKEIEILINILVKKLTFLARNLKANINDVSRVSNVINIDLVDILNRIENFNLYNNSNDSDFEIIKNKLNKIKKLRNFLITN